MTSESKGARLLEQLGVTPIINAGGPNTQHSGSRPRQEALDAMLAMAEVFVRIEELMISVGRELAQMVGAEAATITSGASGGLVVQAAAAMAKDDADAISRLPDASGMPNELIIQRSHRFIYDHLYLAPGARFVEVGDASGCTLEELEAAITKQTAGVIHLESPFKNRGNVPLPHLSEIAHQHGLPVLCDAASMLPPRANLTKFLDEGADLVSFSGGKGIRGPQSTGILLGTEEWVEYARLNNAPYPNIARGQKVSKEEIAGLLAAVKAFVGEDEQAETVRYRRQMQMVVDQVAEVPGIQADVQHNYDHYIPHAVIRFTPAWRGPSSKGIMSRLIEGSPRIYVSGYGPEDAIWVDPLNIQEGELEIVAERLRKTLVNASSG